MTIEVAQQAPIEVRPTTVRQICAAYTNLMKPHVTTLLLAVTALTMVMAAQGMPSPGLMAATLLGGLLAAGSANAINCFIDRDIDRVMGRTMRRSVPAGRISPRHALIFGIVLAIASVIEMCLFVNWLAAALAFGGLLFYVFVYTGWLKRTTPRTSSSAARPAVCRRWWAGRPRPTPSGFPPSSSSP
jgi:protoheme IX farnesyltransferase